MQSWIRYSVGINTFFPTCRSRLYEAGKETDNDLDSILTEARARGLSTEKCPHAVLKREVEGLGALTWMQRFTIYHRWRGWVHPCCMLSMAVAATSIIFVATNVSSRQTQNTSFVTTKVWLSQQNTSFVTTKVSLSRQKLYLWQLPQR